ncbi:MAG: ion transporter [Bdellovibrionales bacterium]|nr:ion transporter [Bdellovibrionales bacterium]
MQPRKFSRKSFYHALEPFQARRGYDKAIGIFLTALIISNIVAVVLETVPSLFRNYHNFFVGFEVFSVIVFTLEYFMRIWTAPEGDDSRPIISRLKFMVSPFAVIDLLAILPFFLPLFITIDLRYLRALRLFRIVRIFKLGRYSKSMRLLSYVFRERAPDLIVAFSVGLVLLVVSATSMYFFEHEAQPEAFSSIPAAMWWAIATLTTVGYGDIYPITVGGKVFGSMVAVIGVGLVAIPTGILGAGLVEAIEETKRQEREQEEKEKARFEKAYKQEGEKCPHCGEALHSEKKSA